MEDGLGANAAKLIVMKQSYEVTDPTVDSQIINLKSSGADVFVNITTPKFAAQSLKKMAEIGWKPVHFLNQVATSIGAVLKPAGFDTAVGALSTGYLKDQTDAQWKDDKAMKEFFAFMDKYYPDGDKTSSFTGYGWTVAQTLHQVLKQSGDNLTRENVMKQAANLKNLEVGLLLPGIKINTGPNDFFPIDDQRMMKFTGQKWEFFGPILSGKVDSGS
jgi:branched-chain amino acid transport system substrate-binding protein